LGDPSKNASVTAEIEVNQEVRAYESTLKLPEVMVANRTHTGSIKIKLNVDERISVQIVAPSDLLVMPESQVISVGKTKSGVGEFTLMAPKPGRFEIVFLLHDSYGIPLPTERAEVLAVETDTFAIVTSDDLLYRALALSYAEGSKNYTVPVLSLSGGELDEGDVEDLEEMPLARVVILGDESVVSPEVENRLAGMIPTERIGGQDVCETSWLFVSAFWHEGSEVVVLTGTDEAEAFEAYQKAKNMGAPLIICGASLSGASASALEDMMGAGLSRAIIWGSGVDSTVVEALKDAGLSVEEAA
jgi:putative cell wall-binding protein